MPCPLLTSPTSRGPDLWHTTPDSPSRCSARPASSPPHTRLPSPLPTKPPSEADTSRSFASGGASRSHRKPRLELSEGVDGGGVEGLEGLEGGEVVVAVDVVEPPPVVEGQLVPLLDRSLGSEEDHRRGLDNDVVRLEVGGVGVVDEGSHRAVQRRVRLEGHLVKRHNCHDETRPRLISSLDRVVVANHPRIARHIVPLLVVGEGKNPVPKLVPSVGDGQVALLLALPEIL
mmetsp:Transcript_19365/g.44619  ORF Transcript_19365/g.44619 Transcript_19365/m.44619 type:complete len:231 (-) Transcript_19365:951-1643(-)